MSTLRDQILARIALTPFRPPTMRDIDLYLSEYESFEQGVFAELQRMIADRIIDTANGDSGLTYTRRKVYAVMPAPSPHAPAPIPQTAHAGLAYFPSKSSNAQPVWRGAGNTPGERKTLRACTVPRMQSKAELSAQAKADKAAQLVKKAKEKKAERQNSTPPDRTSYANRALVTKHLTYPMSAAQFGELAGLGEIAARSMLFNMAHRGFVKSDVRKQPKLYFFERPENDKLSEFRKFAQQFKARRDLDPDVIVADYESGAKMKQLAKKWKASEATIGEILDEQGVKRRARGQLIKGVPRAESRALRAENLALKARIAELESANKAPLRHRRIDAFAGASL